MVETKHKFYKSGFAASRRTHNGGLFAEGKSYVDVFQSVCEAVNVVFEI